MNNHQYFMKQAIELAKKGLGHVYPNPLVGCVIVKNGEIISQGYHEKYGDLHAERNAIVKAKHPIAGATMYVTLEPCCHHGKQPPCCEAIVENKISEVYYAIKDSDSNVNGKGIKYLEEHGVKTYGNILSREAWQINEDFLYHRITGLPFVVVKWGSSIDGRIFTYTKESQWITSEESRHYAHTLRQYNQAIMVGANTLKIDDPKLNVRGINNPRDPIKIIVSSEGNFDLAANIFSGDKKENSNIIIATTNKISPEVEKKLYDMGCKVIKTKAINNLVDIKEVLKILGSMGIVSVLVEGGALLLKYFIVNNLINKIVAFIAPTIIGGENNGILNDNIYAKLSQTPKFILENTKILNNDICLEYLSKQYSEWKEKQICIQE